MLLKVSDGIGGWLLFDNLDQVHLLAERTRVRNLDELRALEQGPETINLISAECFKRGMALDVGMIEFHRNGQARIALFTSVAFICNDSGDTIECVNAGNSGSQGAKRR
jgi:hypothetical protein